MLDQKKGKEEHLKHGNMINLITLLYYLSILIDTTYFKSRSKHIQKGIEAC
jgi:hypothetical protein